jgi:hypothetical protein
MIAVEQETEKQPKVEFLSYKEWLKGTVTAYDDPRVPINGLKASTNVRLGQNGTVSPRPSLREYGGQPLGTVLGDLFEFTQVTNTGKVHWLGCLQNVSGTTKFYIAKDGGTWTVCNGVTFDNAAKAEFLEIDNKVLIMNGKDNLAYFDITTAGTTNVVTKFTALANPTIPTLTAATGLTGTNYTLYYQVVAHSSVGSTAASPILAVQVSTQRENWDSATMNVQIAWSAVTNAKSYSVYMATVNPTGGGIAFLLASGVNGTTFTDNGTLAHDVSRAAPSDNSTAGPIAYRGTVINNQAFLIDAVNPHNVLAGGTLAGMQLDFSDFGGGGDIPIGSGKEFPVAVKLVQSGQGAKIIAFCRGTNGYGKRFIIKPASITSGDTLITYYETEEDNGEDGTDSPRGVVMYKDDAWYPSREGFKKTGVKPSLQTMLKTDTISQTIERDVSSLSSAHMDKCVGLANKGIIYWALPVGSTENNEIWTLDVTREGAWMKSWYIAASAMCLYNDNEEGETHHLILSNNVIYELTEDRRTIDDVSPFPTNVTSGRIKFSDNGQDFAKVLDVIFVIGRPQGKVHFTVNGRARGAKNVARFKDKDYSSLNSVAGWGEAGWGGAPDETFGWSDFADVPVSTAQATDDVTVKFNKLVKWLSWEINSTQAGVNYELQDVIVRFVRVGYIKDTAD